MSKYFIDEKPLFVLPTLVRKVGTIEAIVLQQLHFLLQGTDNGKVMDDGKKYIFNTYASWVKDFFPCYSEAVIKKCFLSLEARGYVVSIQPEGGMSRRKYYRIDESAYSDVVKPEESDHGVETVPSSDRRYQTVPSMGSIDPFLIHTVSEHIPSIREESSPDDSGSDQRDKPAGPSSDTIPSNPVPKTKGMPYAYMLAITASLMEVDRVLAANCPSDGRYRQWARLLWRVDPTLTRAGVLARFARFQDDNPSWKPSMLTAGSLVSHWGDMPREEKKPSIPFCN